MNRYGIHKRLAVLRYVNEKTQADMGELLSMSPSTYSRKERQELLFNQEEIDKMLKLFGVKYEEIFATPRAERGGEGFEVA